jgi:CheY-like chemotaxis protein
MNDEKVILVVDDTPTNIHVVMGILGKRYQLRVATNGEKALSVARKPPLPDLILLDVMMPEMDGYEVCRRLKADLATCDIPVLFVTGHADDAERARGLALGAGGYLSKPLDPEALLTAVADALRD